MENTTVETLSPYEFYGTKELPEMIADAGEKFLHVCYTDDTETSLRINRLPIKSRTTQLTIIIRSRGEALGITIDLPTARYLAGWIARMFGDTPPDPVVVPVPDHVLPAVPAALVPAGVKQRLLRIGNGLAMGNRIIEIVLRFFGMQFMGAELWKGKTSERTLVRSMIHYLMREITQMTFEEIGSFTQRHHSTVIMGTNRIIQDLADNNAFMVDGKKWRVRAIVAKLRTQIENTLDETAVVQ